MVIYPGVLDKCKMFQGGIVNLVAKIAPVGCVLGQGSAVMQQQLY